MVVVRKFIFGILGRRSAGVDAQRTTCTTARPIALISASQRLVLDRDTTMMLVMNALATVKETEVLLAMFKTMVPVIEEQVVIDHRQNVSRPSPPSSNSNCGRTRKFAVQAI